MNLSLWPCAHNESKTVFEVYYGRKPSMRHDLPYPHNTVCWVHKPKELQKLKTAKTQNAIKSNKAAPAGTKDNRIGNRLGKFAPTAVKGLYMYPVCGEKGVPRNSS